MAGKCRPVNTVTVELVVGRVALGVDDVLGCIRGWKQEKGPLERKPTGIELSLAYSQELWKEQFYFIFLLSSFLFTF